MKKIILLIFIFIIISNLSAQIDSSSVFYTDNGIGEGYVQTPFYREFPPTINPPSGFFSVISQSAFKGNYRRLANPQDAKIQFYIKVPTAGIYSVYLYFPEPSSKRTLINLYKKNNINPIFSKHFDFSNPYGLYEYFTSWKLITNLELEVGDSSLTVELLIPNGETGRLVADGVAIVKGNTAGPNLVFGNRRFSRTFLSPTNDTLLIHNFLTQRFPLDFPETFYKNNDYREKEITIFNSGSEQLIISGYETLTDRFSVTTNFPIIINSGDSAILNIKFSPKGEETISDTLILFSNSENEPEAKLPLNGKGTKYYFILNASENNTEPHFNINGFNPVYQEIGNGWTNGGISPWIYPIESGNINGRININTGEVKAKYQFYLPEEFTGNYFIEYSGPAGTSNGASEVKVKLIYPNNADTISLGILNQKNVTLTNLWVQIGNNYHYLTGNRIIEILFENLNNGNEILRTDLLRFREAPTPSTATTSLDPNRIIDFGTIKNNNSETRNFILNSLGETPLVIDSILFSKNISFFLNSNINFPLIINSINGQKEISIKCDPFEEPGIIKDTIFIYTNIPGENSIIKIYTEANYLLTFLEEEKFPKEFSLSQNYPNPFNPVTVIDYVIASDKGAKQSVILKVYDILGTEVATLVNEEKSPGNYSVTFNDGGLPSGIYFYRLIAGSFIETKKMILIK